MAYLSITIDDVQPLRTNDPFGLANFLASMAASEMPCRQEQSPCGFEDIKDIRQTIEGEQDAFRRLIERHQKHISAMMWRFSRDKLIHEELVQDVFVQAYISIRSFKQKSPFSHWLSRIATRVGYRYWKKKSRQAQQNTVSLQDWDAQISEPLDKSLPTKSAELLEKILDSLSPSDRLVITLRYIEEYSIQDTADLTGWSISKVKVQSWRAKKRIEKIVNQNSW